MSPTAIAGYLALFFGFGFFFLFIHLLMGKFIRPKAPSVEKLQIYECGEPAIGSSFVQFDLRFYVVALLFIIFDVEIAFFFPWATVFGKSTHLMDPAVTGPAQVQAMKAAGDDAKVNPAITAVYDDLSVPRAAQPAAKDLAAVAESSRTLALISIADILVFFAVLLVGFAYVWRRGDLDWVRAMTADRTRAGPGDRLPIEEEQPVLVG